MGLVARNNRATLAHAAFAYGTTFEVAALHEVAVVVVNSLEGQRRAQDSGYAGVLLRYRFPHVTTFPEDAAFQTTLSEGAYLHDAAGMRVADPTWTWTDPSSVEWQNALVSYHDARRSEGASGLYLDGSCDLPPRNTWPQDYFADRAVRLVATLRTADPSAPLLVNGALQLEVDLGRGGMQDGLDGRALTLTGEAMGWVADGLLAEDCYIRADGSPVLDTPYRAWSANQNAILGMEQRHGACSIVFLNKVVPGTPEAEYALASTLLVTNGRSCVALQPDTDHPVLWTAPALGPPSHDLWRIQDALWPDGIYRRTFQKGTVWVDPAAGVGGWSV